MTQTNTSSIPVCFICLVLLLLILVSPFVPSHVPVLIGDVYEQLPTTTVVELRMFVIVFVLGPKHEKAPVRRRLAVASSIVGKLSICNLDYPKVSV